MATRGIIALGNNGCLRDGWRGRYAHWDNYPERMVGVLGVLVARDGYEKVAQTLVTDTASWSVIDHTKTQDNPDLYIGEVCNIVNGYGVKHDDIDKDDQYSWYDDECGEFAWACYVYVMTEHGVEVNTVERIDDSDTAIPTAFYTWAEASAQGGVLV
jgi:hypothetical protein